MSALEADRSRIVDLHAQISKLEPAVSALRDQKALVQERLDSYKYPVLTLPPEIVSEIFIRFLPPYPRSTPVTAGRFSPTKLTQICRVWREIALHTPQLWRAIRLSYHSPFPRAHEVGVWLSRSQDLPMAVEIADPYSMISSEVLPVVAGHCARWEHLELYISDTNTLLRVTSCGATPRLRALDLAFLSDISGVSAFPEAPLLRTVRLDCYFGSKLVLPWAQLTSLTLCSVLPVDCGRILQQASSLTHCELEFRFDHDSERTPLATTLPFLESLTVAGDPTPDYLSLGHLIAPTLRHLDITEDFLGVNPVDSPVSFISNAGCTLKDVCIGGCTLWRHTYRKAFPSIKFTFSEDPSDGENDNSTAGSAASSNCDGETT